MRSLWWTAGSIAIGALISLTTFGNKTVYRSPALSEMKPWDERGQFRISDDNGNSVEVRLYSDKPGIPYWYRRVYTPVCDTGECQNIDIGIFWHIGGRYTGLEVYDRPLTKTDHSAFTGNDYFRLEKVLHNSWPRLREYAFENLVEKTPNGVDGVTGATNRMIAEETVSGAAYTTYVIWHLAKLGENGQLHALGLDLVKNDPRLQKKLIRSAIPEYQEFLLANTHNVRFSERERIGQLILKGMDSDNNLHLRKLSFSALAEYIVGQKKLQKQIAKRYPSFSVNEKIQVLGAMEKSGWITERLYKAFAADLNTDDTWMSIKIIKTLLQGKRHPAKVVAIIALFRHSDNDMLKHAAEEFLSAIEN